MIRRCLSNMSSKSMKAIVVEQFGGPEKLQLKEIPVPTCGDNQVLVEVKSVGVNPVETYIRQGNYARLPSLPYIPGNDCAGIVAEIGSGVRNVQSGDRVFCTRSSVSGAYAEKSLVPSDSCWKLPDNFSFQQGAAIGTPYFTAYRALFNKCHAERSQAVLVHGASGAVGLAAVQLAKGHGLRVIGTASSDEGAEQVKKAGADEVFNHRQDGYMKNILDSTNGVDLVLEMLSNVNLGHDLEILKPNGIVAVIGCRGPVEINPRLLMGKESQIIGVALGSSTTEDWEKAGAALVLGLENGTLKPIVGKEYPLDQAQQAHKDIIENSGAKGKMVLNV